MWDEDDYDDGEEETPDRLVVAAMRFARWRKVRRHKVNVLLEVVRHNELGINWSGFALTHGGFFDSWGPCATPGYEPPVAKTSEEIVASGAFCAPWGTVSVPTWQSWRKWYPPFNHSLIYSLPVFSAQRGGIRFSQPKET